jgi:hypothetical protein
MNANTKHYLAWTLRIIISFLFLISAVAKMYPSPYFAISTFEVKQLYPMGFPEDAAAYFSRILIGIELALGFLLLQKHFLRRLVIPATILMLLVFTTHLTIETFVNGGNSGNCGCFGSLLPMTPIEAIIKNVIAMILLGYLLFIIPKKSERGDNFWILATVSLASVLAVFMLAPIQPKSDFVETESEFVIDTIAEQDAIKEIDTATTLISPVPKDTVAKKDAPTQETKIEDAPKRKSGYAQYFPSIDKGRKVLALFVPGCEHCKDAAKELTEMKKKDKNFPQMNIIFMNEEADLIPAFFQYAGAEYPYKVIEIIPFWKILGQGKDTPGVIYLWNGNQYANYWGITENKFNAAEFEKLVKKPYSELKK